MIQLFFATLALLQSPEPAAMRVPLSNGAMIYAQEMPSAKSLSMQLFLSSKGLEEDESTHGLRHLVEHFMARGAKRDVDLRLEGEGAFLRAQTFRDATQFELNLAPDQFGLGLQIVRELLQPGEITPADLEKEIAVMEQEQAAQEDSQILTDSAWTKAYGALGLSPFGDLAAMQRATPEALNSLQKRMLDAKRVLLVIVGPISAKDAVEAGKVALNGLTSSETPNPTQRLQSETGIVSSDGSGEARAHSVGPYDSPEALAGLAAALALASEVEDCFVSYTPSASRGLVVLGRTVDSTTLGHTIDAMSDDDLAALYPKGVRLAILWIKRCRDNPSRLGFFRGITLSQGGLNGPEVMLKSLAEVSPQDFLDAAQAFKGERCVMVVGR